jgi:molybdopterin converting factor small subunit
MPIAYARNHAYADATDLPADGDEVVFLPPIGGG